MASYKRPEIYSTGIIIMIGKEKRVQWVEYVDKTDPERRTRPVVTYTFNDGKRIFHKAKRPSSGVRKSG